MKKNLFLCVTPLQILMARSIILSSDYTGEESELYFFASAPSEKYKYYFELVSPLFSNAELVTGLGKFPGSLRWFKRKFYKKKYRNIYLASLESVSFHYILHWCEFDNIFTYDDGTANIVKSSVYYRDSMKFGAVAKRTFRRLSGNMYSKKRVILESKTHYTLYPGFENVTDNLIPVSLFPDSKVDRSDARKGSLTIFLGSVFRDILKAKRQESELVDKIQTYLDGLKESDVVYLPHPRDDGDYFQGLSRMESNLVAEHVIIDHMSGYQEIKLIGFGSSAQFNLLGDKCIKNIVLTSSLVKPEFDDLANMLAEKGAKIVSLDR